MQKQEMLPRFVEKGSDVLAILSASRAIRVYCFETLGSVI